MAYAFVTTPGMWRIINQVYPREQTRIDTELALFEGFLPLIEDGRKVTTVRYGRDRIRVPGRYDLPLFLTRPGDPGFKQPHGTIGIPRFTVKRFGELTDLDARNDGYTTIDDLAAAIKGIYEPIYDAPVRDSDWVSIYRLRLPDRSRTLSPRAA